MTELTDKEIEQVWSMFERGNSATSPGTFYTKPETASEDGYKRLVTRQAFLSLADQATQPAVHRAIEVHLDEFEPDMRRKLENEIQKRWQQSKPILPESITDKAPAYGVMDNLIRKAEVTRDVVREHKIRLPQYRQYAESVKQSGSLGLDGRSSAFALPHEPAVAMPNSMLVEVLAKRKKKQIGKSVRDLHPRISSHQRFGPQ